MVENCVMEGWHPDGNPGNLAYSPELWEWMFDLGLWLNFDPRTSCGWGSTQLRRQAIRRPNRRTRTLRMPRPFRKRRNRYGFFGRISTREEDPWDMGWWRYRVPGLGEVGLPGLCRCPLRGRLRWCPLGRARGPGLGRDPREGRGRLADRTSHPPPVSGRRDGDDVPAGDSRAREGVSGRAGAAGRDFDVRTGEVHCIVGPNGAGKSTLIKCVSGAVEPTSGQVLLDGEPLAVGSPSGGH